MHLLGILLKGGKHCDSGGQGDAKSPSIDIFMTGRSLTSSRTNQNPYLYPSSSCLVFILSFPDLHLLLTIS